MYLICVFAQLNTPVSWDPSDLPFTMNALQKSVFGFVALFAAYLLFTFSMRHGPRLVRAMRRMI